MKVSDFIADYLVSKNITNVFELSGGMITHLLDSISVRTKIRIVTMHHEQSASFAADVCGRITGIPGIAFATSGPGATNLITGIASCYFDSSPAIFFTGQVNTYEQKKGRKIRQLGFQETDIVSMVKGITKASYSISSANEIPVVLEEAFNIAVNGRPGPVLIDLPMDIQRQELCFNYNSESTIKSNDEEQSGLLAIYDQLLNDIVAAKKPLILAGRGISASFSNQQFQSLVNRTKIPVVTSLLGLDLLEYTHPQRVGFIGSYGNRWANVAIGESDLLLVLGSRLDIRQTGADTDFFQSRKIYHVDCELAEINNRIKGCIPINSDINTFLNSFNVYIESEIFETKTGWFDTINLNRQKFSDLKELEGCRGINPNVFIKDLSIASSNAACYLADVGSHQMWSAQSLRLFKGQKFITSGGMGAMGFALPGAIGASFSFSNLPVVTILGDGCMQLNIQELQTIIRNNLPIKIIVMNNNTLGMIRQFQDTYFESRYQSTTWGYSAPDFALVAKAYGIDSRTISQPSEVSESIKWLWSENNLDKPLLLQVIIDTSTNTYPKIAFGKPITEMEPFSKPSGIEGT